MLKAKKWGRQVGAARFRAKAEKGAELAQNREAGAPARPFFG